MMVLMCFIMINNMAKIFCHISIILLWVYDPEWLLTRHTDLNSNHTAKLKCSITAYFKVSGYCILDLQIRIFAVFGLCVARVHN